MTKPLLINQERKLLLESQALSMDVVIPVYNEGEGIADFIKELHAYLSPLVTHLCFILVDDGSRDDSALVIKSLVTSYPIRFIRLSRNFGKETALTAGLEHSNADTCLIIDADFQHPFNVIPTFLDKWVQGHDMVYGLRHSRDDETIVKRAFTKLFYHLMKKMTDTNIPPNAGDFRLLDRKVVVALNDCSERNRFMKGLYAWVGFDAVPINYTPNERQAGKSRWGFRSLAELALTGLISFSSVPLRFWGVVGASISLLSLAYGIFTVAKTLIYGVDVPGYATIVVAILFLGGIQLLSIGILGEYIGRIFEEVKKRPKYLVSEKLEADPVKAKHINETL